MAADYLAITRNNRPQNGTQLISAANQLIDLCNKVQALNDIGQHCFTGGDYSVFEAQFGVAAGQGANALTLLGLINNILNTATEVTGANRLAQLQEFQARLAGQ